MAGREQCREVGRRRGPASALFWSRTAKRVSGGTTNGEQRREAGQRVRAGRLSVRQAGNSAGWKAAPLHAILKALAAVC